MSETLTFDPLKLVLPEQQTTDTGRFGGKYLRDRPFLIIVQIGRAKSGVRTEKKGWSAKNENWNLYEQPSIVDRISDKIMREASVIVDLMNQEVVKNRFEEMQNGKAVLDYYLNKYSNEINDGIQLWTKKQLVEVKQKAQQYVDVKKSAE